ncbi:MAG: hypothetical protein V3U33_04050, partial [candidate division NC10 bacterium]
MSRQIVRGLFVVLCGLVGLAAGSMYRSESLYLLVGLAVGVAAGTLLVEWILKQVQITVLISALVGLVIGLLLARFLLDTVSV